MNYGIKTQVNYEWTKYRSYANMWSEKYLLPSLRDAGC